MFNNHVVLPQVPADSGEGEHYMSITCFAGGGTLRWCKGQGVGVGNGRLATRCAMQGGAVGRGQPASICGVKGKVPDTLEGRRGSSALGPLNKERRAPSRVARPSHSLPPAQRSVGGGIQRCATVPILLPPNSLAWRPGRLHLRRAGLRAGAAGGGAEAGLCHVRVPCLTSGGGGRHALKFRLITGTGAARTGAARKHSHHTRH